MTCLAVPLRSGAGRSITPSMPLADRDATGIGVFGELQELPDGQAGRVVDDAAVEVVDLVGAMGIAQDIAGDRAQGVVPPDLVDRPVDRGDVPRPGGRADRRRWR